MSIEKLAHILRTINVPRGLSEDIISAWSEELVERAEDKTLRETLYGALRETQDHLDLPDEDEEHLAETLIHEDVERAEGRDQPQTFSDASVDATQDDWRVQLSSDRYSIVEQIGRGGMGEVYKVYDKTLRRHVAMKTIHPELIKHAYVMSHFIEEAQVIAQLQHPNIIPIYDVGETAEGGFYYTMVEVKGFRFDQVIQAVHDATHKQTWTTTSDGWTFHRLISVFLRVCEAVAFAHEMGVLHRDLKPENIMIGSFDAVFVMDWGIAKVIGSHERPLGEQIVETERSESQHNQTHIGHITGTPAYMSPEQARGDLEALGVMSDVYSLGAVLHEILFGVPPYTGKKILHRVRAQEPTILKQYLEQPEPETSEARSGAEVETEAGIKVSLSEHDFAGLPPLPHELVAACQEALSYDPDDRISSVRAFSLIIRGWLEGSQKREKALRLVEKADDKRREKARLKRRAEELQTEATSRLQEIEPWASELEKQEAWRLEDRARLLHEEVALIETESEQLLQAALTHKSDLPEAHIALARLYQQQHEQQVGRIEQKKIEMRLVQHVRAIPSQYPERRHLLAYLDGGGAISLECKPAEADVWVRPYEVRRRRLVLGAESWLGQTPLRRAPLAMGSYRLIIRRAGQPDVYYPVKIGREEHWDGQLLSEPVPIYLPTQEEVDEETCYVPAGWYASGGDPELETSLPHRRIWVDGFFIKRFPVRMRDYIVFLNDLVQRGLLEEARDASPRARESDALLIDREGDLFSLRPDQGELPVHSIDWHAAQRYTQWYSQRTGQQWRLPNELEWEKAARGVDGRFFPWGDVADPSWGCMRDSHQGSRDVVSVDRFPLDESPYGVRGLGGNVIDWTSSVYRPQGPDVEDGRLSLTHEEPQGQSEVVYKGGCWYFGARFMRSADRHHISAQHRGNLIGFRMVRSLKSS